MPGGESTGAVHTYLHMTVMALFPDVICTLVILSTTSRRAKVAGVAVGDQRENWNWVTTKGLPPSCR